MPPMISRSTQPRNHMSMIKVFLYSVFLQDLLVFENSFLQLMELKAFKSMHSRWGDTMFVSVMGSFGRVRCESASVLSAGLQGQSGFPSRDMTITNKPKYVIVIGQSRPRVATLKCGQKPSWQNMQIEIIQKKCSKHSKPFDSICLSGACNNEVLLCDQCVKDKHPHYNLPLSEFKIMFNQKVADKRAKLQEVNYDETPVSLIAKNYKLDMEKEQLKLIESIMKQLGEDKRKILEEVHKTSSLFLSKNQKQLKKVEAVKSYKDYDPATLLLKIKMTQPDKVTAIRDAFLALKRLTDDELSILREEKILKYKLSKYIKEQNLNSFSEKLKELVYLKKSQVKVAPVKTKPREQSSEKGRRGIFDRRRSSDELNPSPKPGIRG